MSAERERRERCESEIGASLGGPKPKQAAAATLVKQALDLYDLGVSTDGEPYALPKDGPCVLRMLRGSASSLRAQLADRYYEKTDQVASAQALADALQVLDGKARKHAPRELHLRVADQGDKTYLDLGDETGRAVEIDAFGWRLVDKPPVLFRRVLTAPLPAPDGRGDIGSLWELLNVAPVDRPLVLAWLVAALTPGIPHPILGLFGEQGTGKTTVAKVLALLLDPSGAPVRKAPKEAEAWVTAASGSWVVALDNLSVLPEWLSDALCRAVTGDGDVRRRLYTDGELCVFAFRRCVIVTGIDLGATRGDFADRLLPVDLHVVDEADRAEEADLWNGWESQHARVLGALLSLAASVKAVSPSVHLAGKPRMADFARVLAAVDRVLGTTGMDRYRDRAGSLAEDSLTGDVFITALAGRLTDKPLTEACSSAELLALATPADPDRWRVPKGWPADARQVTQLLRRQAPVMRRAGWVVHEEPPGHDNALRWNIEIPGAHPRDAPIQRSQRSQRSQDQDLSGPDIGPCVRCGAGCRRYGPEADPLCATCRGAA
jgi:hypothetical protein